MISIAKALNADGVKPPRGHGWAPSAIREMLYRELYRGVIVWNRKQKITRGGTKKLRKRPESEWLRLEAPDLQIIPPTLWDGVQNRLAEVRVAFARSRDGGKLLSRPASSDTTGQYLLTGFLTCGICGSGALVADARMHGRAERKRLVRAYGCSFHRRRGDAVCTNGMSIRQDVLDQAILAAISETLDEHVLDAAIDRALARIRQGGHKDLDRRTQIERELSLIASKMERLLDALAEGTAPKDEIVARMTAEKSRKTTLVDELVGLERRTSVVSLDPGRLKRDLRARVADVKNLLGRHPQ